MAIGKTVQGLLFRDWLGAQGIPWWRWADWKSPEMFHPYPARCTLCGKWWRPDMEHFISLWGRIYVVHGEARMYYEEFEALHPVGSAWHGGPIKFVWHNPDIGDQSTGSLNDHIRHICYDHGDKEGRTVTDCQTGCEVWLPPELSRRRKRLRDTVRDVRYWGSVAAKFAWTVFTYFVHPIRAYKMIQWLEGT
jgi:hypothetical protein